MSLNQYLFAAAIKVELREIHNDSAKLQVQTQIMHQNVATILQHLCCNKISPWARTYKDFLAYILHYAIIEHFDWLKILSRQSDYSRN